MAVRQKGELPAGSFREKPYKAIVDKIILANAKNPAMTATEIARQATVEYDTPGETVSKQYVQKRQEALKRVGVLVSKAERVLKQRTKSLNDYSRVGEKALKQIEALIDHKQLPAQQLVSVARDLLDRRDRLIVEIFGDIKPKLSSGGNTINIQVIGETQPKGTTIEVLPGDHETDPDPDNENEGGE